MFSHDTLQNKSWQIPYSSINLALSTDYVVCKSNYTFFFHIFQTLIHYCVLQGGKDTLIVNILSQCDSHSCLKQTPTVPK